ncbi:MAG: hypothetical protein ABSC94_15745 [Polyangiaceae bacterium]|jgi:hypothetical protein
MARLAHVGGLALLTAGCTSASDVPLDSWSDAGTCGVPAGYVGLEVTVAEDGSCRATSWCPVDSSPICIFPTDEGGRDP